MNSYGAVAYSANTRQFGYSYGYSRSSEARKVALQNCRATDAMLLCCECDCWIALALSRSTKAYGWGSESSWENASSRAIAECDRYSEDGEVVICFSSFDGKHITVEEVLRHQSSFSNTNPRQIEKNLRLPNIQASLIVYRNSELESGWYIRFSIPGPDNRYNPGVAIVPSSSLHILVERVNESYRKMRFLKSNRYKPDFSEEFISFGDVSDYLSVKVRSWSSYFLFSRKTKVKLQFLVSSKTNTFSRFLDLDDTIATISILSSVENTATQLLQSL